MIKPYYQDEWATIYHGDCREILPELEPVDLVLTDPPYGIAINIRHGANWRSSERPLCVTGDDQPFDPALLLTHPNVCMWGANHYAQRLPDGGQWLVWDKRDGTGSNAQADCEIAWAQGTGATAARLFRLMWNGAIRATERRTSRSHPTQKPIALMAWCLGFYPGAQSVLDPYMGSGTTLRAAKDLGIKSIGIEIEEKYCEIAVNRLRQESLFGLIALSS